MYYYFRYFFYFFLCSSGIPTMCMLQLLKLSHMLGCFVLVFLYVSWYGEKGAFFFFFPSLHFSLASFYWHPFRFTDSFLGYVDYKSTRNSLKAFFISVTVYLFCNISFWCFEFPLCLHCMLFTFPIQALNIL